MNLQNTTRVIKRIDDVIEVALDPPHEDWNIVLDTLHDARAEIVALSTLAASYRAMYKDAEDKYTRLVNRQGAGNRPKGRSKT
jgi:hypothetical protein